MEAFGRVVELRGNAELLRQSTMPLTLLMDQSAKAPLWQLQLEQCQYRIGKCARINQVKHARLDVWMLRLQAQTCARYHVIDDFAREHSGAMKALMRRMKSVLVA